MMTRNVRKGDSAISESIGFMLIFTIILAGIGLVTLYGYPILMQQQTNADEKIMEKNMIVLQNDIKSIAYKTVPYKETSLKIGGGSLTVYGSPTSPTPPPPFSITYSGTVSGTPSPYEFYPGELRYESVNAQTDISLQNGMVALRPRVVTGSSMIAEPRWFYDNDDPNNEILVISLIKITSDENYARAGIGTVRMKLTGDPKVTTVQNLLGPVSVDYNPPTGQDYSAAWHNFLTGRLGMSGTGPYTLTPDTLVIKEYEIKIEGL